MRGLLGDAEAMAVAKDFVRTLRAELAAGGTPPPLGLRVYGAGSPSPQRDCRDTRLAARAGDTGADLVALVSAVQPLGVSPLAFALESALADSARTYALITGGTERCAGAGCARGREPGARGAQHSAWSAVVKLGT